MGWILLVLAIEGGQPSLYHMETETQEECVEYSSYLNTHDGVTAFCQPKNPEI